MEIGVSTVAWFGQAEGLAQRMEQLAPADAIAVSQHTHKAVGGFFALGGPDPPERLRRGRMFDNAKLP